MQPELYNYALYPAHSPDQALFILLLATALLASGVLLSSGWSIPSTKESAEPQPSAI